MADAPVRSRTPRRRLTALGTMAVLSLAAVLPTACASQAGEPTSQAKPVTPVTTKKYGVPFVNFPMMVFVPVTPVATGVADSPPVDAPIKTS